MTSKPGLQIIAIHILPNISQSKGNQSMKVGQLIECNKINFFLENYTKNEARGLVPHLFLIWDESKWYAALFQHISIAFN